MLSRLIKVYMTEGTLKEQWQAETTVTQPTGIPTTPPSMLLTTYLFALAHTAPVQTPVPIYAPTDTIQGYGKEITNMAKIYTEEQKYSGTNKSLNYKLTIFYDICN